MQRPFISARCADSATVRNVGLLKRALSTTSVLMTLPDLLKKSVERILHSDARGHPPRPGSDVPSGLDRLAHHVLLAGVACRPDFGAESDSGEDDAAACCWCCGWEDEEWRRRRRAAAKAPFGCSEGWERWRNRSTVIRLLLRRLPASSAPASAAPDFLSPAQAPASSAASAGSGFAGAEPSSLPCSKERRLGRLRLLGPPPAGRFGLGRLRLLTSLAQASAVRAREARVSVWFRLRCGPVGSSCLGLRFGGWVCAARASGAAPARHGFRFRALGAGRSARVGGGGSVGLGRGGGSGWVAEVRPRAGRRRRRTFGGSGGRGGTGTASGVLGLAVCCGGSGHGAGAGFAVAAGPRRWVCLWGPANSPASTISSVDSLDLDRLLRQPAGPARRSGRRNMDHAEKIMPLRMLLSGAAALGCGDWRQPLW